MSDISAAVKIEDISSVKKKLSFDIPWADVKNELDVVYRKVGKTAKVKGFRPGKIPRAILERYYREAGGRGDGLQSGEQILLGDPAGKGYSGGHATPDRTEGDRTGQRFYLFGHH